MASEKVKTARVRLPRAEQGSEETVFVAVNGKGYRIRKGVEVEVPACVAEVLRNAELAEDTVSQHLEDNQFSEPGAK